MNTTSFVFCSLFVCLFVFLSDASVRRLFCSIVHVYEEELEGKKAKLHLI